ncbi:MAG: hypothetical protein AVO33_05595 [delta proteobacterium ML8_F1]|nr:MAG: hypothetical protein AVO33_05595 [delta proteobacterium ML8_F1]
MIVGVGTDIIEIARVKAAVMKHKTFLERVFSPEEISYFRTRKDNYASLAATFAGKEAVSKVLGTGFRRMKWTDIEISRDPSGKPHVLLRGGAQTIAGELGIVRILVSLSHSGENALAYAIGLSEEKGES